MLASDRCGYREIEHTADWELEVWAPDLPALLEQAARGMADLAGLRLRDGPRLERSLHVQGSDDESLLVAFLSELLYYTEGENIGFDHYHLTVQGGALQAELGGAPVASLDKEIKAVTYHRLQVRHTHRGLEVNIVFDV
jgi:SHS2 domain-containing protein